MKTTPWIKLCKGAALALAVSYGLTYCHTTKSKLTLEQKGDSLTVIHITYPANYILLPIEEEAMESQVLLDTGEATDTDMDIRLAQTKVDYFVPLALPAGAKTATVRVRNKSKDALCWKEIKLSDTFDTANTDKFRPVYHHTPLYGWMNDANGLVYKDGEYHLYFQYNPYGSKWGNMHWGHSVSRDLVHWEHLPPAIARDTLGHIFSGSSVVDKENVAGYGAGSILAFYTSASDKNGQNQCLAFSKDNGRTFTKYEKNPILCPSDGLKDFRDPKVFRYEPEDKWVMIVSADKEMRFYDKEIPSFTVSNDYHIDSLLTDNNGAYELALEITTGKAEIMGFSLFNDKGEKVDIYFNLPEKRLVMDRTKSGIVDFGKNSVPHEIEAHDRRKTTSINYIDDFALATWAPIKKENKYALDIFIDKCSVEIFLNGGKIAMTNLVFPSEPYNRMCFYSKGGTFNVDSFNAYRLGL